MSGLNFSILHSVSSEDNQFVASAVGLTAILVTGAVYYAFISKDKEHEFPQLPGIQLYHAWEFFQRRYDFLQSNIKRNPGGFSFNVLYHKVIALTGEDARRSFLTLPHLDMAEGYKILLGIPSATNADTPVKLEEDNINSFNRKLGKILNKARIQDVLPTLLQDVMVTADKWGKSTRIDPFTDIYDLVFLMTARLAACHDLTKNKADLNRIKKLFSIIETGATPASLLLPWFPSPARKLVKKSTTELYNLLHGYVEARRKAEPTSDAMDILIAAGEGTQRIVGFVLATLFAGIANTGIISCWMLIDLAVHSEWREKCKKEIRELLSRHSGSASSGTLREKLETVPVSAWEDELPIVDACIRETQRITLSATIIRRNLREDIKIAGRVVKRGDFLTYSFGDVHLNPEYYPEPYKYDPDRWLQPGGAPDAPYSFLGWGGGRHPCTGMKVAKLEMKLILAMFLTGYEYEVVDRDGKFPANWPVPDRNDRHQARPLGSHKCYFDIKRVVE